MTTEVLSGWRMKVSVLFFFKYFYVCKVLIMSVYYCEQTVLDFIDCPSRGGSEHRGAMLL